MFQIPDAPDIRRVLQTGGDTESRFSTCEKCGEDIGESFYITDEGRVCAECFRDYVRDCLAADLDMIAEALGVGVVYNG